MKRLLLVAFLIFSGLFANAQVFDGVVKDAKTNLPLPYVNVGIIGKAVGTVTDSLGRYKINLAGHDADTLKLSMIGYIAQTYKVAGFINGNKQIIALQPSVTELKEVKVSNKKWKEVVLGNTSQSENTNAGFDANRLGHEIGTIIKIKKSPTYLKRFNAHITDAPLYPVKLRLNFYTLKKGMPDQLMQNQNIFVDVPAGQKDIHVNLEPYNIFAENNFFVSLEWIENSKGHGLMFSAYLSLFGSGAIISRETSQADWEKEGIAGVAFNILAEY
ncbi:carboxypeptidase-like regulatory domain-containing protein [Mucilaginibacter sp. 14171R-50]|uniref:carboxypeptidase-like regulatory domain-containing protein n=1 Tax=Mucilaginibacter sp. 14171R-50 TaxID=2703789 RepID=UPI00138B3542|nr:carboxypeptidase-like regulatory domain-containing protein [Mucilaginibacter sp. 14171R-50]QHS56980.1 carboxypeptidase-like regulatory domain-containing protein [Mucilaginibacter sp. 14171R-50]